MPSNITPTSAWTDPLTGPANGDPVDGGAGGPAYDMGQKLANRIEFLKDHVVAAASERIRLPFVHLNPVDGTTVTAGWAFGAAGTAYAINQVSATGAYIAWFEIVQPKTCTLTEITVNLAGAAGHGALPTMPTITLYRQDTGSLGAPATVGTATDTAASVPAYEAVHPVALTGLSEVLAHDSGLRYYLKVTGEAGGSAVAGLALLEITGEVTV